MLWPQSLPALAVFGVLVQRAMAQIQAGSLYQGAATDTSNLLRGKVYSRESIDHSSHSESFRSFAEAGPEADCVESELDSGWNPLDQCFYVQGGGKSYRLKGGNDGGYCLQRTKGLPCDTGTAGHFVESDGECHNLSGFEPDRVQFSWKAVSDTRFHYSDTDLDVVVVLDRIMTDTSGRM